MASSGIEQSYRSVGRRQHVGQGLDRSRGRRSGRGCAGSEDWWFLWSPMATPGHEADGQPLTRKAMVRALISNPIWRTR